MESSMPISSGCALWNCAQLRAWKDKGYVATMTLGTKVGHFGNCLTP